MPAFHSAIENRSAIGQSRSRSASCPGHWQNLRSAPRRQAYRRPAPQPRPMSEILGDVSFDSSRLNALFCHLTRFSEWCARGPTGAGGLNALNHDRFDFTRTAATEGGRAVVFRRLEARHPLLESGKFDHDETMEFVRTFHNLKSAAARKHLAAELGDDGRHQIGVLLVFDWIVDFGTGNPVGGHVLPPS